MSKKSYNKTEGFDIFEDVSMWPDKLEIYDGENDINVIDRNYSNYQLFIFKNNISTDMEPKNSEQIMWRHGQCLSFEVAKSVKLSLNS